MFLKRLSIEGFKSIAERTEIDLLNDVNVIMGPNGSGKSNFFECIQWILGGLSAKQLRASTMEDVIFDGGENRSPAKVAQGTLIFDNKDRELDIDTDEVEITRKLTRGKGNEYFINGEPAKLKDLTKLFLNKGIGKNNYAITGQNRITEFIMMKPEEIRGVIEEAAGISGFRLRKNELVTSIANYDRDIEGIDGVINEIERNLKPLKKQMKNVEIYQELKKELDERKLYYHSTNIKEINNTLEIMTEEEIALKNRKEDLLKRKDEIEEEIQLFSQEQENIIKELENKEKDITSLEELVSELNKDKIMKESNSASLEEKISSMKENMRNLEEASSVEEGKKNELFEKINKLDNEIKLSNEKINDIDKELMDLEKTIEDKQLNLQNMEKEKNKLTIDNEKGSKDIENLIERNEFTKGILKKKNEERDNVISEIEVLQSKVEKNNLTTKLITGNISEYSNIDKKLKSLENVINASKKNDFRKKKNNEIKALLKGVPGFHDTLCNVIKYNKKYDNAIETLHGGILFNFIVENVKAAEECVKLLKINKIPPANFIILDKIKTEKSAPELSAVEKVSSVLTFDKKYEKLINNYFGATYIANDSNIAEEIWNETKQKYRISTIDGVLYSANTIRGGYIEKDSKKIQEEYKSLLKKQKELLTIDEETCESIYELKSKINFLTNETKELNKRLSSENGKLKALNSEKSEMEKEIAIIEEKVENLKRITESNAARIEEIYILSNDDTEEINIKTSKAKSLSDEKQDLVLKKNSNEILLKENEKNYYVYKNSSQEQIEILQNNIEITEDQWRLVKEELEKLEVSLKENDIKLGDKKIEYKNEKEKYESQRAKKETNILEINQLVANISNIENELTKNSFELEKLIGKLNEHQTELEEVPNETEEIVYEEDNKVMVNRIDTLTKKIKSLGFINTDAVNDFNELNGRFEEITNNKKDLEESKIKIMEILQEMQDDMLKKYMDCFDTLKKDFSIIFKELFNGGDAELSMENPNNPLESGVIIKATPPGKKNKAISLLSGGEKSLAAVSFIFALLKYSPSPVVIFDEIDAALDEINVALIADYINKNRDVQYVIVSHRKPMMKVARALYGASMTKGVTGLLSQKLA